MKDDPIDTIKTFDLLEEPDIFEEEEEDGFDLFRNLRYEIGQTDRHGIPLDKDEFWQEV